MNTDGILSQAQKLAAAAKPGMMRDGNDIYTFVFNLNSWHYDIYKNGFEYIQFNTKLLKVAKQWLREYLSN